MGWMLRAGTSWIHVLKALEVNRANGRPSALIIKQEFPPEYAKKVGLVGGNMANAMKVLGVCGCISDGPIRDLDELRELGMHMYATRHARAVHGRAR